MKKDFNLLDYLIQNDFYIILSEVYNLRVNEEVTLEQEYRLYKKMLEGSYIDLIGILPDVDDFTNNSDIIEYLLDENIIYKENIEDIIIPSKISEIIEEYYITKKIYFKYINLNEKDIRIEEVIDEYNQM